MSDVLQQSLHTAAASSPGLTTLAVIAANSLIVLLGFGFVALAYIYRARLTREFLGRAAVSGVVALLCVQVLGHAVHDPRPYMAEHYAPLAHAASDNGFPSDHALVVALLTGWLGWLLPPSVRVRWLAVFALGAFMVAFGRLAIGAHHTLDLLGSLGIAVLSLLAGSLLRFSPSWQNPVLTQTRRS